VCEREMKSNLSVCFHVMILLSMQERSTGKVLRHAQSSVGEAKEGEGECRSKHDMPKPEAEEATIAGYNSFIDGVINGEDHLSQVGTCFVHILPPPSDDDEDIPSRMLTLENAYPKVVQGWKVHYQPPHGQIQIAMETAVEKLLELKADFKIVGVIGHDERTRRKKYVWMTFSDPPVNEHSKNNLFGKMITIYGHKHDFKEPDPMKLSKIVVELNRALKEVGIVEPSNVPPPDCRMRGEDFLSGFSMRYGVHRNGHNALIDSQMYKITQKSDGTFVCWCEVFDSDIESLSDDEENEPSEVNECECPKYSRRRHRDGDATGHIYEDDIREATIAIQERDCTCRPNWVTWNAGDLVPECPNKGTMLEG